MCTVLGWYVKRNVNVKLTVVCLSRAMFECRFSDVIKTRLGCPVGGKALPMQVQQKEKSAP